MRRVQAPRLNDQDDGTSALPNPMGSCRLIDVVYNSNTWQINQCHAVSHQRCVPVDAQLLHKWSKKPRRVVPARNLEPRFIYIELPCACGLRPTSQAFSEPPGTLIIFAPLYRIPNPLVPGDFTE